MTLKLYTFRAKHTGHTYYATAHTSPEAAHKVGIALKDLILERSEIMPVQMRHRHYGFQAYKPLAER